MSFRWKIMLLAVVPLVVATSAVAMQVLLQSNRLMEQQASLVEATLTQQKRAQLIDAVELVRSQVEVALENEPDETAAARRVQALVASAQHGPDGYFFGYDLHGVCVLHGRDPTLVGKDLWATTDPAGNHVIQSLLEAALHGDGFLTYEWQKPSTGKVTEKLAYVTLIPRWGWVFGTGLYLDDMKRAIATVREQAHVSVVQTMRRLALGVLLVVTMVLLATGALNVHEQRIADAKLRLLNQGLVALNERVDTVREQERARVAGGLHDSVIQSLAGIKHHLESAARHLTTDAGTAKAKLAQGIEHLGDCIVEVRQISRDLYPADLNLGLRSALERLVGEVARRSELDVVLAGDVDGIRLPARESLVLYRVAQEAIGNAEQHASAHQIEVELRGREGEGVVLRVTDDGCGFETSLLGGASFTGIGLRNMRQRVEDIGGLLRVESRPGRTELRVMLRVT